jgi:cytosine/adenosine deaminase-related metal-dependent hydrolase
MLIRADTLLTMRGEPIARGAVRIEANRITEVGPQSDFAAPSPGETVLDLGDCILCPGFINAHCHLDYTLFKGLIQPSQKFTDWIVAINALKRQFALEDFHRAVTKGFRMLLDSGTTTVANIESFPELLAHLETPPLRVWWFLELIDVRTRAYNENSLLGALQFFENMPSWLGGFGLSPHAPYTASVELYRLARRCCEQFQMPFTTHISESVQEQEMFVHGRGDLYNFMAGMGRDMSDCGHGSALTHLLEHGVLTRDCLAVHLNYLQDYDLDALAASGVHVVHCPKCHTYFGHSEFRFYELRDLGVNICLGSDSLASNNTLDMRAEIREARAKLPGLSDREWLETVTLHPARAVNHQGELGEISTDALADLVAFPWDKETGETSPYSAIIASREKPLMVMIDGKVVMSGEA